MFRKVILSSTRRSSIPRQERSEGSFSFEREDAHDRRGPERCQGGLDSRRIRGTLCSLEFDDIGAKLFEQITSQNVRKRLAIILDNNIYSAPVIQEKIPQGRAQITGRFDTKEASDLAIVLRAGALPAPVKILEQRTVGPSLGQDSIHQGIVSTLISAALMVLFMIFYYRFAGVIADVALTLTLYSLWQPSPSFGRR